MYDTCSDQEGGTSAGGIGDRTGSVYWTRDIIQYEHIIDELKRTVVVVADKFLKQPPVSIVTLNAGPLSLVVNNRKMML